MSVTAVARALRPEGLETSTQAARRRASEHDAALLECAERTSTADVVTVDWLRQRLADGHRRHSTPLWAVVSVGRRQP